MASMVVGFVVPYVLVHVYFYYFGSWESYYYVTYEAPRNYSSGHDLWISLKFNFAALMMYLPVIVMAIASWKQEHISSSFRLLLVLLLMFDLIAVNITGKPFKHYLLQLAIPLSLIAGEAYSVAFFKRIFHHRWFLKVAFGLMLMYAVALGVVYQHYRFDNGRELVAFFKNRIKTEDTIYAADAPNILYWYFDKRSPTKYVHSTLLVLPTHIEELQIDVEAELNRILSGKPTYIVISDRYPHKWFVETVSERYQLVADLKKFTVYQISE